MIPLPCGQPWKDKGQGSKPSLKTGDAKAASGRQLSTVKVPPRARHQGHLSSALVSAVVWLGEMSAT